MSINPEEIKSWSTAASAVVTLVSQLKTMVSSTTNSGDIQQKIDEVETEAKKAEAVFASRLGFEVCLRCWPPEIMLMNSDDIFVCRACKRPTSVATSTRMQIIRTHASTQRR